MNKLVITLCLATGLALTILSGETCQRIGSDPVLFEGVDPGFDTVHVTVGGWPAPYLEDRLSTSPVGSVSVVGGLVGVDHFRVVPFLLDLIFYLAVAAAPWVVGRLIRKGRV